MTDSEQLWYEMDRRKCHMYCESCGAEHYAPLFDGWKCDCDLSIIVSCADGKEVSRRVNNKNKQK